MTFHTLDCKGQMLDKSDIQSHIGRPAIVEPRLVPREMQAQNATGSNANAWMMI